MCVTYVAYVFAVPILPAVVYVTCVVFFLLLFLCLVGSSFKYVYLLS